MIRWEFLEETLHEVGFQQELEDLIMKCVSSCSMQVLFNGDKTNSFNLSRAIRQENPLSPNLFVLCLERLGHCIEKVVNDGRWKPVKLNRDGHAYRIFSLRTTSFFLGKHPWIRLRL